jgi:penicillin-binding protein 1C
MYASLARTLNHYYPYDGRYDQKDIRPPVFDLEVSGIEKIFTPDPPLSAGAIYLTFQALLEVNRPEQEAGWEFFTSSKQIAWKTGTSFGFRDGWAIGTTPGHVVGVWVGNADGEGRPGLTGISTAAPILFEIFNSITGRGWFDMPYDELREVAVCRKSGYLKTGLCAEVDTIWVLPSGLNTLPCPYHHLINTDKNERFRVNSSCIDPSVMRSSSWFVLPPVMEWYYKMKDPSYRELPPYKMGCRPDIDIPVMQFIYPENGSHIFIPMELDGIAGDAIAELAHRNKQLKVFWHLDGEFLGVTQYTHQMAIRPEKGKHHLRTVDENGNEAVVVFTVEGDKEK